MPPFHALILGLKLRIKILDHVSSLPLSNSLTEATVIVCLRPAYGGNAPEITALFLQSRNKIAEARADHDETPQAGSPHSSSNVILKRVPRR